MDNYKRNWDIYGLLLLGGVESIKLGVLQFHNLDKKNLISLACLRQQGQ